ncbi:GT-D fold domain-containing glycosyltransferase [Lachnoclostridium sp.]|uniref:GT-D fold domain-containing glycosyltransferase n=1 Tax=Lachnoclostridium sp. TaxID=2028282 RepID=UPI002899DDBF|nr:GT-D fold domain-containing glycosyltransferase [Lachnoclostridium sp.]
MKQIYIWGTGNKSIEVLNCLIKDKFKLIGFIDNDPEKVGKNFFESPVCSIDRVNQYDYLIVAVVNYNAIKVQLEKIGADRNKVIFYFSDDCNREDIDFINLKQWKLDVLTERFARTQNILLKRLNNLPYEIQDNINEICLKKPLFRATEEAIKGICHEHKSMIRFGDGEFDIISKKKHPVFQENDDKLAEKLIEVLHSKDKNLMIAIANNYGSLEQYTDEIADGIRAYMTDEVRKFHNSILDLTKEYYDAYMFKCYYPYKDKENTDKRVKLIKSIWENRDIVVIEGAYTRTGYGNDLFNNARNIKRILAPTKNAFAKYSEILSAALNIEKEKLILIALGPAGKVLGYQLYKMGYQIVDIGQIDMDYEWYRANTEVKINNPLKYVSQLPPNSIEDIKDKTYLEQILVNLS